MQSQYRREKVLDEAAIADKVLGRGLGRPFFKRVYPYRMKRGMDYWIFGSSPRMTVLGFEVME
jgi:hypothetical protein